MGSKTSKKKGGRKNLNQNQLRSLLEGSKRLGVSYWSLYRAGEAGFLKTVRLGGRVMIPESELAHAEQYGFGRGKRKKRDEMAAEAR